MAPLFHDIRKATKTLLLSGSAAQLGITDNDLGDAAAEFAAKGVPSENFHGPTPTYTHRFAVSFSVNGGSGTGRETASLSPPPQSSQPSLPSLVTQLPVSFG